MLVAAVCLCGCSSIGEDERLIEVKVDVPVDTVQTDYDAPLTVVPRRVLVEDHTGQECVNCPDATDIIHSLQTVYGDLVVPVAIHSKLLGIMEPQGLGNELGNFYADSYGVNAKPAGLINRIDAGAGMVMDKTIWTAAVKYYLENDTVSPLDIRLSPAISTDGSSIDIDVKVLCTRDAMPYAGRLQVWMTEDSIVARQLGQGWTRDDYMHNHVLRAAVNGNWGEDFSLTAKGDTKEYHYALPVSAAWNKEHLAVVAFAYNDDGVMQATRKNVKLK